MSVQFGGKQAGMAKPRQGVSGLRLVLELDANWGLMDGSKKTLALLYLTMGAHA